MQLARFSVLVALGAATLVSGCGRPATDAECREILTRIVELELRAQNISDPSEVEKRRTELEESIAAGKSGPYEGCVGKRITEGQLRCVREAKTSKEITNECLR